MKNEQKTSGRGGARPNAGRKPLPPEARKARAPVARFSVDFTPEDGERIVDAARTAGVSSSAWIRMQILTALQR